jgi:CRISPR system Cascade subunit CasB
VRQPPEYLKRLVAHLHRLHQANDRAALARLRRGLGKEPGSVWGMHGLVQPWLPADLPRYHEDACYLIASLFASHPEPGGEGTLGKAFARLRAKHDSESIEKRFVAMLDADAADLPSHLRHAVSLLASAGVPVDWARLLDDVQRWGRPERFVQRRWSRDYWATDLAPAQPVRPHSARS